MVLIHSNGNDLGIQNESDAVATLQRLRDEKLVKQIGLSAKTLAGAQAALDWADVLMVEYHLDDHSQEAVIAAAQVAGIGVVVKKALASGKLPATEGLRFVLGNQGVSTVVVGTLNAQHLLQNLKAVTGV